MNSSRSCITPSLGMDETRAWAKETELSLISHLNDLLKIWTSESRTCFNYNFDITWTFENCMSNCFALRGSYGLVFGSWFSMTIGNFSLWPGRDVRWTKNWNQNCNWNCKGWGKVLGLGRVNGFVTALAGVGWQKKQEAKTTALPF